jgi:hypothetical protein
LDRFSLFSESRERLGAALGHSIERLVPALIVVLRRNAERALDIKVRVEFQETCKELETRKGVIAKEAVRRFNELVFRRLEIESNATPDEPHGGLLELLPDADLDEQVYADDLSQRIRAAGGEEYAALVARVHALTEFTHKEDRCPLAAGALAASLIQTLRSISKDRIIWSTLRPEIQIDFPNDLAEGMADVNDWLRQNGILPELPRFIAKLDLPREMPSERRRPNPDPSATKTTDELEQQPDGLIDRASLAVGQALTLARETTLHNLEQSTKLQERAFTIARLAPTEKLDIEGAAFAGALSLQPYSRDARTQFFSHLRSHLSKQQLESAQGAVIDIVQSLFDYAITDDSVIAAAKPLLWRLQLPTVILSLLDTRYLGDQPQSLRRLIENLSAIVMAFPDDIVKGSELYNRLDYSVRAIEIVAHTLQNRANVLATLLEKEFSNSAKSIAMIAQRVSAQRTALENMPEKRNRRNYKVRPNREIELATTEKLTQLIGEKLQSQTVPQSVREFLGDVWLRRLRSAALRDGEDSQDYKTALRVVDDLLWSVGEQGQPIDRRALATQIPTLVQRLNQGVRSVGLDVTKFDPFFDELFLIHLRRMQRQRLVTKSKELATDQSSSARVAVQPPLAIGHPQDQIPKLEILQVPAPEIEPTVKTISPSNDEPLPVLSADDVLIELPTPNIPSLISLSSKDYVPSSSPRDSQDKTARLPKASRVSVRRFNDDNKNDGRRIKIHGIEQLAAAAQIKIGNLPQYVPSATKIKTQLDPVTDLSAQEPTTAQRTPKTEPTRAHVDPLRMIADLPTLKMPPIANEVSSASIPSAQQGNMSDRSDEIPQWDASTSERKLLDLMMSVDLTDRANGFARAELEPNRAISCLEVGVWVELITTEGSRFGKVAWINDRRTVILIVRERDQRAMSLRLQELLTRFGERRAYIWLKEDRSQN